MRPLTPAVIAGKTDSVDSRQARGPVFMKMDADKKMGVQPCSGMRLKYDIRRPKQRLHEKGFDMESDVKISEPKPTDDSHPYPQPGMPNTTSNTVGSTAVIIAWLAAAPPKKRGPGRPKKAP